MRASSSAEAIERLERESAASNFAVGVFGYALPDLDGETLARALMRRGRLPLNRVVLDRPSRLARDAARLTRDGIGVLAGGEGDAPLVDAIRSLVPELPARPLRPPAPIEATKAEAEPAPAPPRTPGRHHVLVAEDNPVNQRVVRHVLRRLGYDSTVVEHGALAVDAVQSGGIRPRPHGLSDAGDGTGTRRRVRSAGWTARHRASRSSP